MDDAGILNTSITSTLERDELLTSRLAETAPPVLIGHKVGGSADRSKICREDTNVCSCRELIPSSTECQRLALSQFQMSYPGSTLLTSAHQINICPTAFSVTHVRRCVRPTLSAELLQVYHSEKHVHSVIIWKPLSFGDRAFGRKDTALPAVGKSE